MKKSLCITICMCLLCLLFFNICYADVPAAFSDAVPLKSGDLDLKQLSRAALSSADVPEVIPHSLIAEKQHVNRLYAQEEGLDTVIFQNRDGSKTAYIYDAPVKYLAEDGSVRDKSNALTGISGEYRYMNMENDVVCILGCEHEKPGVIANLKLCRDCRESIARGLLVAGFVD